MTDRVDPRVDVAFHWLLARQETRAILVDLLEAALGTLPDERITEIELLNPYIPRETVHDKLSVVDVKARDQTGRQFIVEMQMLPEWYLPERIHYYGTRAHSRQLRSGDSYGLIAPTICICIYNGVWFPGMTAHRRFRLLDDQDQTEFTRSFEIHTLELAKLPEDPAQLSAPFEIWGDFLRRAAELDSDKLPPHLDRPILRYALEELDMLSRDELERERYENRLKVLMDERSRAEYAKQMAENAAEAERQLQGAQQQLQGAQQQLQGAQQQLQDTERQLQDAERQRAELEQRIAAAEQRSSDAAKQRLQFLAHMLRIPQAQQDAWMCLPLEQLQDKVKSLEVDFVREWSERSEDQTRD
jgi:predicted transposase/invertase (TIGR01784 family)